MKTIALSGGFDPLHVGHVEMINKAAEYGKVLVILNSDEWLMRKKGYIFMPWEERQVILLNLRNVYHVVSTEDLDNSSSAALYIYKPDYFGNGGDRAAHNTPEDKACEELGIEIIYGLGQKIQSSSDLVKNSRLGKSK